MKLLLCKNNKEKFNLEVTNTFLIEFYKLWKLEEEALIVEA